MVFNPGQGSVGQVFGFILFGLAWLGLGWAGRLDEVWLAFVGLD
jgi:hypothetical protein